MNAYRYPVVSRTVLTTDARGRGTSVGQWCNEMFTFNLFNVRDIGLVVVVLNE